MKRTLCLLRRVGARVNPERRPASNYSLSASSSSSAPSGYPYGCTSGCPSFTTSTSGTTLTGGANSTVYDSGSVSVTVNGFTTSVSYGSTSTGTSLASALASSFNSAPNSPVTATASGNVLNLTSLVVGAAANNYSLSASSQTNNPTLFNPASFTTAPSGPSLTGGTGGYSLRLTYAPDGDILSANDSVNGNWTYSYDPFNRLVGTNQNSGQFIYSYVYDRYGNRWQQNGFYHPPNLSFTGNNNRIDGYSYDAAGNLLNDGTHSYFYDAENRIVQVDGTLGNCSTATACYIYNAEGQRIRKTTGSTSVDFLYDLAGHEIAQVSSAGVWQRGEVYAGGRHLASYSNSTTYFTHADWLGTERARTTATGAVYETCTSLPFGDFLTCSGSDPSPMHFTGKERDSESSLDYFGARFDSSSMGRFMSADPIVVTGRRLADPQRLNLYAYARNNPLRYTDPTGMDLWEKGCGKESDTCHKDYAGTWDQDHKNFTRTTIQTDSHGNVVGHEVNFDSKGIHIDGKFTGVFASNTQATVVNGTGALAGFQGTFDTNCRGTCAAGGILTASPGHSFDDLIKGLRGPNEKGDHFSGHLGDQYRGGNREGTDIHLSYIKGDELQGVHFDWRFPFGSWDGLVEHSRDVMINNQRQKTMTSDPPADLVGPAEP